MRGKLSDEEIIEKVLNEHCGDFNALKDFTEKRYKNTAEFSCEEVKIIAKKLISEVRKQAAKENETISKEQVG